MQAHNLPRESLVLIDLASIYWAAWHASKDQAIGEAYERTLARVRHYAGRFDRVAVCVDCPPYKRKSMSAAYKAQRDSPDPGAVDQYKRVQDRLRADGRLVWGVLGYEADDIIATAVAQWESGGYRSRLAEVYIVSGDKDLLQLASEMVRVINPRDDKHYGPDECRAKFGVDPAEMRDFLALCGDSSDNVPGVRGIGAKRAAQLIMEWKDIDGILNNADKLKPPSVVDAIVSCHADLMLSRQLVTLLTDAPIAFDELFEERSPEPLVENDMSDIDDEPMDDEEPEPEEPKSEPRASPVQPPAEPPAPPPEPNGKNGGSKAIVVRHEQWALALEPHSIGGAYKLAVGLFNSRLYTRFGNPEAIMAVMIRGRELGMGALTSLDLFHIIEGRPSMHAQLIVGLCKQAPSCEYFMLVDANATRALWCTKRRGEPKETSREYTMQDAEKAGLLRPSKSGKPTQWQTRPKTMLVWRAATELARFVYPDIVGGLYTPDELSDGQVVDGEFTE